jgi:hypothetical protein
MSPAIWTIRLARATATVTLANMTYSANSATVAPLAYLRLRRTCRGRVISIQGIASRVQSRNRTESHP